MSDPTLEIVAGTGLLEAADPYGVVDSISQAVGQSEYVADYMLQECLLPVEDDQRVAPAIFDRFYFRPEDEPDYAGLAPILADVLFGEPLERQAQEQEKQVALKRAWCEEHGWRYAVVGLGDSPESLRAQLQVAA